jgi:hypothetical protein
MKPDPEHESVDAFVQFCLDDERTTFTHADLAKINNATRMRISDIRKELEDYGLTIVSRDIQRSTRGFTTSSHDRWSGPGSCPTFACSGWEVIAGFATTQGFMPKG